MLLRTLGELSLEGSRFSRPKPLLLLAYLALEGPKPRRYLAELFFMDTKDPFNGLSQALKLLRRDAPSVVKADLQKVWTTLPCDATQLLTLADNGNFGECVTLYEGPFAETLNAPLGAELEEWVYGTREYLAGRAREAWLKTAEQVASKGDFGRAASHAEKAYTLSGAPELEPDDFQRVYTLLAVGGSPLAGAVRSEAEAYALPIKVVDARRQPASREITFLHNLPPRRRSFIGRGKELKQVAEHLVRPDCRLLTLHGPGGVGKSRLALQVGYDLLSQERFHDGVYFVPLDTLLTADLIPSRLAESLGVELNAQVEVLAQVKRFIGDRRLLLILDNYEHLIEEATLQEDLLDACPGLHILVTSRERLNLRQEWVLTLEGLSVPTKNVVTLAEAEAFDAFQFLVQCAKRARLDFSLAEPDLPHALDICRLVDGSPLGLELAGAWVRVMPLADISAEIARNLSFLTASSRDVPERHQSIRAALEHSWRLLTPKEQEILKKLSVFRGGFRREAAAEVADGTLPVLANFLDKALLKVSPDGRYDSHVLLRQYAEEKLLENPAAWGAAQARHSAYFRTFLGQWLTLSGDASALAPELDNLLDVAQRASQGGDPNELVDVMYLLTLDGSYYAKRGHNPRSLKLLESAAETAKVLGELSKAHYLLSKLANAYRESTGDLERALNAYQTALTLAEADHATDRQVILLSVIGMVRFQQGADDADEYLNRAYQLAKTSKDDLGLVHVLQQQGNLAGFREFWQDAHRLFTESVEVAERLGRDRPEQQKEITYRLFFALMNLGEAERMVGSAETSLRLRRRAYAVAEAFGNEIWTAHALLEIGELHVLHNEHDLAQEHFERALELYTRNNLDLDAQELRERMTELRVSLQEPSSRS